MNQEDVTAGAAPTMRGSWKSDLVSGFLVFLIALPLCLGISLASGYPPIAGVFTAIIGGILTTFLSNSELTIKGPAAGLIPIAIAAVTELGQSDRTLGYQLCLGVGVVAGLIQILFGLCKFGKYGDFFPLSAVHGMLAAIGVTIIAKQFPYVLGVQDAKGDPISLLGRIPEFFQNMNPEIALIGGISLLILFGLPLIRHPWIRRIPAPMVVLLVAVPMGMYFDLTHEHAYFLNHREYHVGENYLVNLPPKFLDGVTYPNFSALTTGVGWKFVLMFALVGSLESLLSAKAIDLLDPYRRTTNLNRDTVAIGIANTCAALVGGLPMISEIVRSKANIDNGAKTRLANMFHGLFLLAFVALLPALIHRIPLAALAAMLVYTGFRLASPSEFIGMFRIGPEQLVIFLATIITTLATDLLVGIGVGIVVKFLFHLVNGLPLRSAFRPEADVERPDDHTYIVVVRKAAVFSNWLGLKKVFDSLEINNDVIVDLSSTRLVDHTVMEKLHEMERAFREKGRRFDIAGLDQHRPLSSHPFAARKKSSRSDRGVITVSDFDRS